MQLVVFRLDEQQYGLPIEVVDRIVRAAELTPLPTAPNIVLGAIDVDGQILPVLNVRQRFRLPERDLSPAHQFLIARSGRRTVILVIDEALGVIDVPDLDIVEGADISPGIQQIRGAVRYSDGLVLIHDVETFLSLDEERALDQAMSEEPLRGT